MTYEELQSYKDDARQAVLSALDQWARETQFTRLLQTNTPGATDAELPDLFRAIDAHVERVLTRAGVCFATEPVPEREIR